MVRGQGLTAWLFRPQSSDDNEAPVDICNTHGVLQRFICHAAPLSLDSAQLCACAVAALSLTFTIGRSWYRNRKLGPVGTEQQQHCVMMEMFATVI
jgi:hypothetical protein